MKRFLPTAARVALGLIFAFFGANGLLQFLPVPPPPPDAAAFLTGVGSLGYFLPLMAAIQVLCGVALLANRFVPLALVLLAPIVVNIVGFHLSVAPPNALTFVVLGCEAYLGWAYRSHFRALFVAAAAPTEAAVQVARTAQPSPAP